MHERNDIANKKDLILELIAQEQPKMYIASVLDCKIDTLNRWLKKLNIEYEGQKHKKGQKKGGNMPYRPSNYYTDENDPQIISADKLKKKLIRDGIKPDCCEECGVSEWRGVKIALQLHHINGIHTDNRLSNLIILCPNCHSRAHKLLDGK